MCQNLRMFQRSYCIIEKSRPGRHGGNDEDSLNYVLYSADLWLIPTTNNNNTVKNNHYTQIRTGREDRSAVKEYHVYGFLSSTGGLKIEIRLVRLAGMMARIIYIRNGFRRWSQRVIYRVRTSRTDDRKKKSIMSRWRDTSGVTLKRNKITGNRSFPVRKKALDGSQVQKKKKNEIKRID